MHVLSGLHIIPFGQHVPLLHREFIGQQLLLLSHACVVGQQTVLQTLAVRQHTPLLQLAPIGQHVPLHIVVAQHMSFASQYVLGPPIAPTQQFVPQHLPLLFIASVHASPFGLGVLVTIPFMQPGVEQSPALMSVGASVSSGPSIVPPLPSHRMALQSPTLLLSITFVPNGFVFCTHAAFSHTLSR
jgi:hypothetical protein